MIIKIILVTLIVFLCVFFFFRGKDSKKNELVDGMNDYPDLPIQPKIDDIQTDMIKIDNASTSAASSTFTDISTLIPDVDTEHKVPVTDIPLSEETNEVTTEEVLQKTPIVANDAASSTFTLEGFDILTEIDIIDLTSSDAVINEIRKLRQDLNSFKHEFKTKGIRIEHGGYP